jgi:hypothetical protein
MRLLSLSALTLALCAAPAFAQISTASLSTPPMPPAAAASAMPANASNPSVDFAALREQVAEHNKELTGQLATQRAILRKNQELLKEAQKLQAANLKLVAEQKKLEAQNLDLDHQRQALKAAQTPTATN